MRRCERFPLWVYPLFVLGVLFALLVCVCVGSVNISPHETARTLFCALIGKTAEGAGANAAILLSVRLPRVLCALLIGASLSVAGAAMQGLLHNPLADGSTLGVSAGASLGAVLAIAMGLSVPWFPLGGVIALSMAFAFGSLLLILFLAHRLDPALSTNTILLAGVVFSMFANSAVSLIVTFAGERVRSILFWTLGSLAGRSYGDALALFAAFIVCGGALFLSANELNAFSLGEKSALYIGVDVKRAKLVILAASSALIGVCVSVSGTIAFVGLIVPHMVRRLSGPNHKRLLPAAACFGAVFLMLADLAARTVLSPLELPVGVVTSLVGTIVFLVIFSAARKRI